MSSPLDHLLEEGIITEVVGRLQSGKEAEVFVVRYAERIVAAKVYKDRTQRSFKNNSAYKEGRGVRNTRDQRAMGRRSRFGKSTEEEAWKSAEADALYRLHAAEVRVPTPVLFFEGVLLMELVVDADGNTARRLIDTALTAEQANLAYHDMLGQLVRMLACDLIHGDLSPYNVLWGASGVTIIDFPQIVSAAQNSNSERFFLRDAENILGHFRQIDPRLATRRGDAAEIWRAYLRRELTADFMPTGKVRLPPPQRPLPIHAPRTQESRSGTQGNRYGAERAPNAAYDATRGSAVQQQQRNSVGRPQHARSASFQPSGGRPAQQQRPQQSYDGRQPQQHGGRSQSQQGGRSSTQSQQHGGRSQSQQGGRSSTQSQQHGGRSQSQQGGRSSTQSQQHGSRSQQAAPRTAGSGFGKNRPAMPEVIVRPRANAPAAQPAAPAPSDTAARELPGRPAAKRR